MNLGINNGVYRFCGRMLALSAVCAALWCAAPEKADAEMRVTAGVERFSWGEYSSGVKMLDESGPRYVAGFTWLRDGRSGLLPGYNGKLYSGDVTYNGRACTASGQCSPFSTTTGYQGMLNEALLHYRLDSSIQPGDADRHYLDLVAGLGVDFWTRDIKKDGGVAGYKENYTIGFLRAGIAMLPAKSGLEAAAGFKYPLYLNEIVGFKALGADGDPVLHPKADLSYYASIGWRFNNPWSVTLEFDSYRFKESDTVSYTVGGVPASPIVQPESRMEVMTLKAGYSF